MCERLCCVCTFFGIMYYIYFNDVIMYFNGIRNFLLIAVEIRLEQNNERENKSNLIMGLKEEFEEHAELAKTLPENTTNENKLILYGLFKQATVGPVNTSRPGIFNMRDRAKWDAWKANEAKSKEEAMSDYITKVKQLKEEAASS
ncbi:hypothetical protein LUZ60_011641 [Juncus effusus]|nr:hypothetical protein LUZ60_011641 [Juncus effusus]